jgi:stress responsive alpha/beta barrel protein
MIKHIVMIKLKEFATPEEKVEKAKIFREMLMDLANKIPQLKLTEVGLNISTKPTAFDVVLTSIFDSVADLDTYREHPAHALVLTYLKTIMEKSNVVDYKL